MRLIGLDPGLRLTGWGVIDVEGNRLCHVAHGVVRVAVAGPLAERLRALFDGVAAILEAHRPDEAAVEETFVNVNPGSTLKLGQARGVVMLAPARAGLPVFEYAANLVKKSVTGVGHADKRQIAMMVGRLLPGAQAQSDAADALAVAICHAHHRPAAHARSRGGRYDRQAAGHGGLGRRDSAVVDVGGVGYLVVGARRAPCAALAGREVAMLVETIVREDAISLYGFLDPAERDWFRILTTVQGVGAKVALSILSTLAPDEIARAIVAQDRAASSRPAGVGAKLAARLATELKDKAAAFGVVPGVRRPAEPAVAVAGSVNEDAVSALVNLGYRRVEAFGAVARAAQRLGDEAKLDAVIRAGLQELAR